MQSKIPLYPYSAKDAMKRGEIEKWRESFRENCACAGGIDILILENFDGMHLKAGALEKIIELYAGAARRWTFPSGQPSLGGESFHSTRRNT